MTMGRTAQELSCGHGIRPGAIRAAARAVLDTLNPGDAGSRDAVSKRLLIGKYQVDWDRAQGDHLGNPAEMFRVSPLIVIVEKAKIAAAAVGHTIIPRVAWPMPVRG